MLPIFKLNGAFCSIKRKLLFVQENCLIMFKILAQVFLLVVCIPYAQLMLMKVRNQENNFLLNLQRGDEMPYNGNAPWANAPQLLSLEETMEHADPTDIFTSKFFSRF